VATDGESENKMPLADAYRNSYRSYHEYWGEVVRKYENYAHGE